MLWDSIPSENGENNPVRGLETQENHRNVAGRIIYGNYACIFVVLLLVRRTRQGQQKKTNRRR